MGCVGQGQLWGPVWAEWGRKWRGGPGEGLALEGAQVAPSLGMPASPATAPKGPPTGVYLPETASQPLPPPLVFATLSQPLWNAPFGPLHFKRILLGWRGGRGISLVGESRLPVPLLTIAAFCPRGVQPPASTGNRHISGISSSKKRK